MRTETRFGMAAASAALSVFALAAGSSPAQAQIPAPPKVLGCELGPNVAATRSCLEKAIKKLNDDVNAAEKAAEAARQTARTAQQATQAAQQAAKAAQEAGAAAQQQLQKPWVAAMTQIDASQITNCLASRGINVGQTMSSVAQNPPSYIRAKFTEIWQKAMMNSALVSQQIAARASAGSAPSLQQLMDSAEQSFAAVAAQDPAAQCLWAAYQPYRAQARAIAAQIYPIAKQQFDAMVEQRIKPAVNSATVALMREMNAQIRAAAASVPRTAGDVARASATFSAGFVPEKLRLIAVTEGQRYLLEPGRYARLIAELDALQRAVAIGDASAVSNVLPRVERELATVNALGDQIVVDIAIRALRDVGHEQIDREVPKLLDSHVFLTTDTLQTVIANLVTGIVAFWYHPPNAISEVIAGVIVIALNAAKPAVKSAIVAAAHTGYDTALDTARRALSEARPPSSYIPSAGPLGELLRDFPTEAELLAIVVPEIGRMRAVLAPYHDTVRALSRAASAQVTSGR
jgi:hypothetical protein